MAKRSKRQQTKHDKGVKGTAQYYEEKGYKVEADLKGYDKPKNIGGRIPDIRAVGSGEEVIVEVETDDTIDKDRGQHEKFNEYAKRSPRRRFWKKTV
ncbi:hypothetical protein MYX06_04765 [Patescibacteria group bacterium AH-259-L05]|nr:hypothetical protein [Patescibacteria group bacterium AH-259-L05]